MYVCMYVVECLLTQSQVLGNQRLIGQLSNSERNALVFAGLGEAANILNDRI